MPEELSKNQLKKLAKKAEKAAKKGGKADAPAAAPTKPQFHAKVDPVAAPPSAPPLSLHGVSENASTLKVVWSAMLYDVHLQAAKKNEPLPPAAAAFRLNKQHPVLSLGNDIVSGGGNSMAQTIMRLSGNGVDVKDLPILDNWVEWEKNHLRSEKPATVAGALVHLTNHLTNGDGVHLVGNALSVADVCVLTTLLDMKLESTEHPALSKYVDAHLPQIQIVKDKLHALCHPPILEVDMSETSLQSVVFDIFSATIRDLYGESMPTPSNMVTKCAKAKDGDYQCIAAMPVFSALKKSGSLPGDAKSPAQIADQILAEVQNHPILFGCKIVKPGFVVCRLNMTYLQRHLNQILAAGNSPVLPKPLVDPKTCVVDFSSPNIAKEMHVGHLRSTIIGESVCRILEYSGHTVHRVNHVGDWGTQFGMLIQYLQESFPTIASGEQTELPNISDLTEFYKNAKARFDESADFKKLSQTNVVKLQAGDPSFIRMWQMLCDVSRQEFAKVYKRLDVTTHEFGESFYNEKIPAVIDEFTARKKLSVEEGGAKCVFVEGFQNPLMLQKSDGGYGYDSTDMAALKYRLQELKADRIIVITDYSQSDHFKMVYAAGKDIGWLDRSQQLEHIGFGTVNGEDGKRFKTRSGETVRLVDLLDEAVGRMEAALKERIEGGKASIKEEDLHETAEAIGYGAVKYFDLSRNPTKDYKFSYEAMLDTKGDTAVYLLFARARLESILAKGKAEQGIDVEELIKAGENIVIDHPSERNLALSLMQFTDSILQTLDDLYPCHICEYVYNLSNAVSEFITQCYVLGSPEMKSRLMLCYLTTVAMSEAFDLLGIRHIKRI